MQVNSHNAKNKDAQSRYFLRNNFNMECFMKGTRTLVFVVALIASLLIFTACTAPDTVTPQTSTPLISPTSTPTSDPSVEAEVVDLAHNLNDGIYGITLKVGEEAITIRFEDLGDYTGGIITHDDYEDYIPMEVNVDGSMSHIDGTTATVNYESGNEYVFVVGETVRVMQEDGQWVIVE